MSDEGNPKRTVRFGSWDKYDEFVGQSEYKNRSEAVRDALTTQMNQGNYDVDFDEQLYNAFSTYALGLADRNPRVTATGVDMLRDIDDELGRLAEEQLEKIE